MFNKVENSYFKFQIIKPWFSQFNSDLTSLISETHV